MPRGVERFGQARGIPRRVRPAIEHDPDLGVPCNSCAEMLIEVAFPPEFRVESGRGPSRALEWAGVCPSWSQIWPTGPPDQAGVCSN